MTETTPIDPAVRRRNRIALVALVLVFVLPFLAAGVLNLMNWRPAHTTQHGTLLQPPVDLTGLKLHRADGSDYPYAPQERRWHIVVVPTADCAAKCVDLIHGLEKVWRLQGRRAERLHVLWFGALPEGATPFRNLIPMRPDPAVLDRLPELARSGSPSVYLIDSFGFLMMRYAPGVDVADLRADIAKLLK
jgi:hypothetical protein